MKKHIVFILVLFLAVLMGGVSYGEIIVGRITHVDGQIYRYMDADQSWVETFADSPVGTLDVLRTAENSRAEMHFPNHVRVQLDQGAEIEVINLEEEKAEFFLQAGLVRLHKREAAMSLIVATPRGLAKLAPGAVVDLKVDAKTVLIAAVKGEATFMPDGSDSLEVLSGATKLELTEDSIVAGTGPISSSWNRWCLDRESAWTKNYLVRSEYLPETMQEYAYALEPFGSWRRVYYRGHYYWAWQPRYVASGWAPYTTGYWHDWHGDLVWIDHNPWGWVTHHHGHWLHLHGAWVWTPYVHVSYVPGVTVVGFNITYGKKYRPHWHPGRVRWITYSSHVGWLPLAPWETYYGCRNWGPRSVAVHGNIGFSINVNLGRHRYVDHAVIVPKKHFRKRGRVAINHYNDIRIKNVSKTVIINNYEPLPGLEKRSGPRHEVRKAEKYRQAKRPVGQSGKETRQVREFSRAPKYVRDDSTAIRRQRTVSEEKKYTQPKVSVRKDSRTVAKKETAAGDDNVRKSYVKLEKNTQFRRAGTKQAEARERNKAEKRNVSTANLPNEAKRSEKIGQAQEGSRKRVVQTTASRTATRQTNTATVKRKNDREEGRNLRNKANASQSQLEENASRRNRDNIATSRKQADKTKQVVSRQERQRDTPRQNNRPQVQVRDWRGESRGSGRFYASGSLTEKRFR